MTRIESTRIFRQIISTIRNLLFRMIFLFFSFFLSATSYCQESSSKSIYIAGSGNTTLDQHISSLLQDRLGKDFNLVMLPEDQEAMITDTPIVSIGPSAFSRVRQVNRSVPILAMFVEKDLIDVFASRSPGQISGVFYNVPLLRQALTGKSILPNATKVALLATTESVELYEPLLDALPAYGMTARVFVVDNSNDLIPTLVRALRYGDFVLAAPDDTIYNPRTIKHILLTAYRHNRVVIGPSQAYVKAGSLASSYAPFSVMVGQASRFLKEYFASGQLPPPAYPDIYRVKINRQVARSMNIPLSEGDKISHRVEQALRKKSGVDVD